MFRTVNASSLQRSSRRDGNIKDGRLSDTSMQTGLLSDQFETNVNTVEHVFDVPIQGF